jgi:hypothetical protein
MRAATVATPVADAPAPRGDRRRAARAGLIASAAMTRFWMLFLAALLSWQAGWAASHHAAEGADALRAALHRTVPGDGAGAPDAAAAAPVDHDRDDGAGCCAACHGLHHLLSAGRGGFMAAAQARGMPPWPERFPADWTGPPLDRPRWSAA